MKPKALVLDGYGLNCGYETKHAFDLVGFDAERVHINDLLDGTKKIGDYQVMAFIGGFSFGDDHGAGVLQSVKMKSKLEEELLYFIKDEKLIAFIVTHKHDEALRFADRIVILHKGKPYRILDREDEDFSENGLKNIFSDLYNT